MRKIPKECAQYRCSKPHYKMGLCEAHYNQNAIERQRENTAVDVLHTGLIVGKIPVNLELQKELVEIRKWWNRACDATNFNRPDSILADEAEYASSWCISLTKEIVDAELAYRKGEIPGHMLDATRDWVWDRFRNLEAGLMSNGVKRTER